MNPETEKMNNVNMYVFFYVSLSSSYNDYTYSLDLGRRATEVAHLRGSEPHLRLVVPEELERNGQQKRLANRANL